jgi:hypothetical protein
MKKTLPLALIATSIIYSSCVNDMNKLTDIKGMKVTSELALPLLNDELGIKELYQNFSNSGIIRTDDGEVITMVYTDKDSISNVQLINIPPTSINLTLDINSAMANAFNIVGKIVQNYNGVEEVQMSNGELIDEFIVKNGVLDIYTTFTFKHPVKITYTYPTITKNGAVLKDSINVVFVGATPTIAQTKTSLSGYKVDMTSGSNKIPYQITVEIIKDDLQPQLLGGESLKVTKSVDISSYESMKGYLGNFTLLKMNENVEIDLFYGSQSGSIEFNNPRLYLDLQNGFGLPVTARIYNVYARLKDNTILPIVMQQYKDTVTLPYPQKPGEYAKGSYFLDKTNSNIDVVLNSKPTRLFFKVDFIANYTNTRVENFMFDTSTLKTKVDLELPLDFKVSNYEVINENYITLPGSVESDGVFNIEEAVVASLANNTMPLGFDLQVYFIRYDSATQSKEIIDSLYAIPLKLAPANINEQGDVVSKASYESFGVMTPERYKRLLDEKCNYYMIKFLVNTSRAPSQQYPFVRLYANQRVSLKVGFKGRAFIKQDF